MNLTDNDKASIIHISSVSKHPHAAMIVKWLITGWDVIRKDDPDNIIISPRWHKGEEYELIEPKPAKPAYRVYTHKGSIVTYTQDRLPTGKESSLLEIPNTIFLTDWIEYDPPKKWPTPLVGRIAAIDLKAAEWIVENWDDLLNDKYTNKGKHNRESNKLKNMFTWIQSPQEGFYWEAISNKLGEQ